MLFGIIGTTDRGNILFDRWPRMRSFPKVKGSMTAGELSQKLLSYFYYFGIFTKESVFETSEASFSETCMIQIFNANEKRLQVVLGIDDECVMVSQSVFIINNQTSFGQPTSATLNNNLFFFEEISEEKKDIVNSVTLVWKANNFEQVEKIKNKLSFLIGALRQKQQSSDFLSKQIIKITEAKNIFEKKVKQKCAELNKDSNAVYQEFDIKGLIQSFNDEADQLTRDIEIFKQMSTFYDCCLEDICLKSKYYKVPNFKIRNNQIVYKKFSKDTEEQTQPLENEYSIEDKVIKQIKETTTLVTLKKLEMLPQKFHDSRVEKLYNSVLTFNDVCMQDILGKNKSICKTSALQTVQFIKENKIGLNVFPFDLKKYYNLFALKKLPSWPLIRKFGTKIFPTENLLSEIYPFSKFKRVSNLNEKLKYIILQDIIKEVDVYIYYIDSLQPEEKSWKKNFTLEQEEDEDDDDSSVNIVYKDNYRNLLHYSKNKATGFRNESQKIITEEHRIEKLLENFVNKEKSLNQILKEEPRFDKISMILKLVIDKMQKKNGKQRTQRTSLEEEFLSESKWGFYYIERS